MANARRICRHLLEICGHDLPGYKMSRLVRRIRRRMQVLNLSSTKDYLRHLQRHSGECDALLNEFLINVTRFFCDPDLFEVLHDKAIRPMMQGAEGKGLRVWVPGHSSGAEAYSVAMLIEVARAGTYPISALADIPEPLRGASTTHRDAMMQITPHLSDRVRCSLHRVLRDPPFARVDLFRAATC
ncbi:CheR family methyltransferase [Paracoccus sp. (in: a-proteobacteria)]|uniref:CheR family methyltransferase n=1 Tax=Paracoccus sp. TaxID=267 RepID=UPI00396C9548